MNRDRSARKQARPGRKDDLRKVAFPVFGLGCGAGASRTVEKALERVPGVQSVYVNPADEMAHVVYDRAACTREALLAAVGAAGYQAGMVEDRG